MQVGAAVLCGTGCDSTHLSLGLSAQESPVSAEIQRHDLSLLQADSAPRNAGRCIIRQSTLPAL